MYKHVSMSAKNKQLMTLTDHLNLQQGKTLIVL